MNQIHDKNLWIENDGQEYDIVGNYQKVFNGFHQSRQRYGALRNNKDC